MLTDDNLNYIKTNSKILLMYFNNLVQNNDRLELSNNYKLPENYHIPSKISKIEKLLLESEHELEEEFESTVFGWVFGMRSQENIEMIKLTLNKLINKTDN